jgi:transcriptional regulator with XRE-family HTH domain
MMNTRGYTDRILVGFSSRFARLARTHDEGLSNAALGKLFGVSSTTVFKWKNARMMPNLENACLIALRYQVGVDWLLTGRASPAPEATGYAELKVILPNLSPESLDAFLKTARAFAALEQEKG